ncbi:MAG: hypothetical protein U5N86_05920 [Planctomycetota bacterium]|nr:hypothetical protein [Planctomycetota bacterium]
MRSGELDSAMELLARASALPVSDRVAKKIVALESKVSDFRAMLAEFETSPVIDDGKLVEIKLRGAGRFVATIVETTRNSVTVRNESGIKVTLDRSSIESMVPLSVEQVKDLNRRSYKNYELSYERAPDDWLRWLKAFRFARKFELYPELYEIYDEARGKWSDLLRRVLDYKAYKLYRRAMYYFSRGRENSAVATAKEITKKYPESPYSVRAKELISVIETGEPVPVAATTPRRTPRPSRTPSATGARPTPRPTPRASKTPEPEATVQPDPPSRVLKPPKATNDALIEANEMYLKAKKLISAAFDKLDTDDYESAVENFDKAIELLRAARNTYDEQAVLNPRRTDIRDFIEQVNKLIYLANKSKPLGVW